MTNTMKQLANALSDALQCASMADTVRERGRAALDAYKESDEFKRDQFEEQLRGALKAANELADLLDELRQAKDLKDGDAILLESAYSLLAEGADYLNTVIEGPTS